MLSVGLGKCVYLWSAGTCKVTKLCNLGPYDSVTSVNWAEKVFFFFSFFEKKNKKKQKLTYF